MSKEDGDRITVHYQNALKYAEIVTDEVLDKVHPEIREHWRGEMEEGMRLRLINFQEKNNPQAEIRGSELLDRFGDWWNANKRDIKVPRVGVEPQRGKPLDWEMERAGKIALLALTFAFGLVVLAYEGYADRHGWAVGAWFRDKTSFMTILGAFAILAAPVVAGLFFPWWTVAVVIVGGFFLGLTATRLLRSRVQIVAVFGLPACWVADILYVLP